MAELSEEQKIRIVVAHAQFRTNTEIAELLREEWPDLTDINLPQIVKYNPARASYEGKAEYRKIYDDTRRAFLEEVSSIPIAQQAYRLNVLQQNLQKALKAKNLVLANQILEQASKEAGGAFTNERNLNVRDVSDMTADERRERFGALVEQALGRAPEETAH